MTSSPDVMRSSCAQTGAASSCATSSPKEVAQTQQSVATSAQEHSHVTPQQATRTTVESTVAVIPKRPDAMGRLASTGLALLPGLLIGVALVISGLFIIIKRQHGATLGR